MEDVLTISAIEPQKKKKDRFNIYADGEYIASLGAEALVKCGVKTGATIGKKMLADAVMTDNAQYAFDSAARMLAHGMRTRGELTQRLLQRGIPGAAIEQAMEKLSAYGYVDDAAYAQEYVRSAMAAGRWGRRVVAYRLKEKGLERSVIDAAMAAYTDDDERRIAQRQAGRLIAPDDGDARRQRQRVFASLTRHGFAPDTIRALFSEADE